jgi:hypothetical protein
MQIYLYMIYKSSSNILSHWKKAALGRIFYTKGGRSDAFYP